MSTYYEYQDVKVMIAMCLFKLDGWKVYGWHDDNSDSMTDYYDPAYWGGVAEKNGYVLCVDVNGESKGEEIRKYNYDGITLDTSIQEKIKKLEQMTMERGASEQEEESAKKMIAKLREKANTTKGTTERYVVIGHIPGHMAHPPKMNWHIEKDGIIVEKGNGILKFSHIDVYYRYPHYKEDMERFRTLDREKYKENYKQDMMWRWNETEEQAEKDAESHIKNMEKDLGLMKKFEAFINKIDTTCGGLIGDGDGYVYEKVTVTEYKKEIKVVETVEGSIKEGQLFILKSNFNYGHYKGLVFRIHEREYEGKKSYYAYKLNGKKTKECTGMSDSSNYWSTFNDKFMKWIESGAISWCELQEVQVPYKVEKVVKKTVRAEKKTESKVKQTDVNSECMNYTYHVSEDVDTRTSEKIWLVRVEEKLSKEEYIDLNKYMKSIGGYYSRFKHSFLFKEDPSKNLGINLEGIKADVMVESKNIETITITYLIEEDIHTQTKEKIWVVKPEKELNKEDFVNVRQKLATLKGYYSSFKRGFIFKYDPHEVLNVG